MFNRYVFVNSYLVKFADDPRLESYIREKIGDQKTDIVFHENDFQKMLQDNNDPLFNDMLNSPNFYHGFSLCQINETIKRPGEKIHVNVGGYGIFLDPQLWCTMLKMDDFNVVIDYIEIPYDFYIELAKDEKLPITLEEYNYNAVYISSAVERLSNKNLNRQIVH